ncbi:secretion system protein [Georgenia subflava]|uniref:Secretion system protein n=1 Tax=Georgenia subflava TaxID=1622177 RepID=A0A6N7EPD2_9MICO|nr:secretion system protein [Georgenia subflava]
MVAVLLVLAVLAALPWALADRQARTVRPCRRVRRPAPVNGDVDVAVLLDLADAALGAGAAVPGTLQALGRAVSGPDPAAPGAALRQAGSALLLGAPWEEAWAGAPRHLAPLADALEPAWLDGAAPGPLLRQAAGSVRATRHRQAQEAAARLGVRLVLPLGLCFLPAFVLLGLVPVVIAAGGGILGG